MEKCNHQISEEESSFQPSKLGTREHWDEAYERELANFEQSGGGDIGECWFGEDTAERVADFVAALPGISIDDSPLLEVGTGNGHLLLCLAELGLRRLTGSDYSPSAVELARRVAEARGVSADVVSWVTDDVLDSSLPPHSFQVIVDKGTFDAVSLSDDRLSACSRYAASVARLLQQRPDAYLVITSCNWTQEELLDKFAVAGLVFHSAVCYPTFTFGGHSGSKVVTVALTSSQFVKR
eukprot:TRINITY_DN6674_c0_g1_i1.p1 TRINITY_DN6674_c0_g1~~TRINITY_DN6674_c0_g1_i1.p1  ORF type:complete len:278 (-),score=72.85 TRINITY_DN6674_c0_g1_i1:234-947(-)